MIISKKINSQKLVSSSEKKYFSKRKKSGTNENFHMIIRDTIFKIKSELSNLNQNIPLFYQISESELKSILYKFFTSPVPSISQGIFLDKKEMLTNHSAVYFINENGQHCLFIKPNVKNDTRITHNFHHHMISLGSQKRIKKTGLFLAFSDSFQLISCYQCSSFSKTIQGGKNEDLKNEWEINARRNGFFPVSFEDGQKILRHIYLIPFYGEPIEFSWRHLSLQDKLQCIRSIFSDVEKFGVHDIKIANTLIKFSAQSRSVRAYLIDGYDKRAAYTYTPYSPPIYNRGGNLIISEEDQEMLRANVDLEKEVLEDFKLFFDFTNELWPSYYSHQISLSERTTLAKDFIGNLKHAEKVSDFFFSTDENEVQTQLLSFISKSEYKIKRQEYFLTPASEQELTETRIFGLAVMFWKLLNINRAMSIQAIDSISVFNAEKLCPAVCRQNRFTWCLEKNGVDETPLTEMVLKAYERNLSYHELYHAICQQLSTDYNCPLVQI